MSIFCIFHLDLKFPQMLVQYFHLIRVFHRKVWIIKEIFTDCSNLSEPKHLFWRNSAFVIWQFILEMTVEEILKGLSLALCFRIHWPIWWESPLKTDMVEFMFFYLLSFQFGSMFPKNLMMSIQFDLSFMAFQKY